MVSWSNEPSEGYTLYHSTQTGQKISVKNWYFIAGAKWSSRLRREPSNVPSSWSSRQRDGMRMSAHSVGNVSLPLLQNHKRWSFHLIEIVHSKHAIQQGAFGVSQQLRNVSVVSKSPIWNRGRRPRDSGLATSR